MSDVIIVKGPHILFKGTNGSITAGIRVRSLDSKEAVEDAGRCREWNINTFSLAQNPTLYEEILGSDFPTLLSECQRLEK